MAKKELEKELKDIASKYDNMDLLSSEVGENGEVTMRLSVKGGPKPPNLPEEVEIESQVSDITGDVQNIYPNGGYSASASVRRLDLDVLSREDLDLLKPSILTSDPQKIYQRSIDYYRTKDIYGSAINALTNFAAKGFENDIDDEHIKGFYDNWVIDVEFDDLVEKLFFDFFRVGLVRTYKVLGRYEPKINFLSSQPKDTASKKEAAIHRNRFTRDHIPIAYTMLNPTAVRIKGSLMFGQAATYLDKKAGEDIKKFMEVPAKDRTAFQKKMLDSLPSAFKKAVQAGEDIPLDPELIGHLDYRRMPYERYPLPRGSRAFEAVEFKDELRKADYSTLDGITNYILLVKVGSDKHPVSKQDTLDRVSELFDTVSKSYKVVWNHTLDIQKITSPEIGEILGQDKYKQVNDDLTGALGVIRAILDGKGDSSSEATKLAVKSLIEEINYARRQVARWIYKEYRAVAEVMGFDRIPKVRFDDMALRDEIQMMAIVQGMIDRRIISYRTGQKKLGFDPETELAQLEKELPLVEDGVLGLIGSPFQQSSNRQQTQGTPSGTPSEGRPKGKPAKTPDPPKDDNKGIATASVEEQASLILSTLSTEQLTDLLEKVKSKKEKAEVKDNKSAKKPRKVPSKRKK